MPTQSPTGAGSSVPGNAVGAQLDLARRWQGQVAIGEAAEHLDDHFELGMDRRERLGQAFLGRPQRRIYVGLVEEETDDAGVRPRVASRSAAGGSRSRLSHAMGSARRQAKVGRSDNIIPTPKLDEISKFRRFDVWSKSMAFVNRSANFPPGPSLRGIGTISHTIVFQTVTGSSWKVARVARGTAGANAGKMRFPLFVQRFARAGCGNL